MAILTRGAYGLPGSSLAFKTGTWRTQKPMHHPMAAPCHTTCLAEENPQAWLALIEQGELQQAWETLVAINPLPAITGRVCPHPCETGCNRGQYDEPICMHGAERFLGDEALRSGWAYNVPAIDEHAPNIAVVGAGPAGLSAAYHLCRLGYRASLFEREKIAGGVLRTALPAYRLPRDVLNSECEHLLAIGLDERFHTVLGKDVSIQELLDDFAAIFLGPGAQKPREWSAEGAVPSDLHEGVHLLNQWVEFGAVPDMHSAAVIGGGNTAIDVARVLIRAGVNDVHVITHRELPDPELPPHACMTANPNEISQAIAEGVIMHPHHGITRLILRGERAVGVELVHMKKLYDEEGHLHRVPFEGTEEILHVDQVIPAIGQQVDAAGMEELLAGEASMSIDHWGRTAHAGIFAGGDARGGPGSVARAVADGRRAAEGIHAFIHQQEVLRQDEVGAIAFQHLNMHYYNHAQQATIPVLPVDQRKMDAEVEGGLDKGKAMAEAARCLSCGQCLACDNCWTLCPDNAVLKTKQMPEDGSPYVFDYDYCKGCGICASECPCGFIRMEEEEI